MTDSRFVGWYLFLNLQHRQHMQKYKVNEENKTSGNISKRNPQKILPIFILMDIKVCLLLGSYVLRLVLLISKDKIFKNVMLYFTLTMGAESCRGHSGMRASDGGRR
jgi:hypothetical protein